MTAQNPPVMAEGKLSVEEIACAETRAAMILSVIPDSIPALQTQALCAMARRSLALEAELKVERSGRCWFWMDGDPDNSGGHVSEIMDYADIRDGEVIKVGIGRDAGDLWAFRVTSYDENGDVADTEIRTFTTEAEARAALTPAQSDADEGVG